jgi:hypothetical protein
MKQKRSLFWGILFLPIVLIILGCVIPGFGGDIPATVESSTPQVTVSNLVAGQKLEPAQEVKIQSTSVDIDSGIVQVELLVNNQVIWVDANPEPQPNTPYIVAQSWTPQIPGSYVVQVQAYNVDNITGKSEPLTVDVVAEAQSVGDAPAATPSSTPTAVSIVDVATSTSTSSTFDSPTPTLSPNCTPPPCKLDENEVYYCADVCPGGCGTTCATVTPTPTSTPTPGSFSSTGLEPDGRFKDIWREIGNGDSRLGYPTGEVILDRNFARQFFERGLMFWWDNPAGGADYIWVIDSAADDLKSGTTWNRYDDTWPGGDEFSCDEARANGNFGPIRGFGQVWCHYPELQIRLGHPTDYEGGSGGSPPFAQVHFFQGGVMIYNPLDAEVFVLFDQGDWQRFRY